MLFLFLDCETTGLTKMDQIMEVGAVLVDFDEISWQMTKISEFETLVKIDTQIDDKISRITGIDNRLLNNAPKLETAQNLWQNWLCKNIKIKQNEILESNLELRKLDIVKTKTRQNEQKLENETKESEMEITNLQNTNPQNTNPQNSVIPNLDKNNLKTNFEKREKKTENQQIGLENYLQKIQFQDLKPQNLQLDKESQNFNYKKENSVSSQENSLKIAIIGHSLGFDLGFLKRENWFLPESFERIDTLDLSKIFLPHLQAVNLEFLTKKLNLNKQILEINSEINSEKSLENTKNFNNLEQNLELDLESKINENLENTENSELENQLENEKKIETTTQTSTPNLQNSTFGVNSNLISTSNKNFHRAKFDAICCYRLLEYLVDLFVLCYILDNQKNYFTDNFLENLEEFLPLNLLENIEKVAQNKMGKLKSEKLKNAENLDLELTENTLKTGQNGEFEIGNLEKTQITSEIQNSKIQNEIRQNKQNEEKIINLQGLEITSIEQKLNNWKPKLTNLREILNQKLPKNLTLLTLQLYFVAFFNKNWKELNSLFENRNAKISKSPQNSSEVENSTKKPKLKLHTQKDLFVIATLLLEND